MKRNLKLWLYLIVLVLLAVHVSLIVSFLAARILIGDRRPEPGVRFFPISPAILSSFLIATFLLILIVVFLFRQIDRLISAMRSVAGGDFSVRLDESSRSELNRQICHDFNVMAEELSRTETLRDDFIASVSHEFKTPLASIEGYAALLMDRSITAEERTDYTERILESTRQLSTLIGSILKLSKLDSGAIDEKPSVFPLDEQIREALLSMEPQWSAKNLDIDMDLTEVQIKGYRNLLFQVWTNLYSNAVKFSNPDGILRTEMKVEKNTVRVSVTDSGPGMTEEQKRHIFNKFYQGDTAHRSEGNGLGLSIVMRILELSHGTIDVESAPGEGAAFTVTLPLNGPAWRNRTKPERKADL